MAPVVVLLLLTCVWLGVRATRRHRGERLRAWALVATASVLTLWFAVEQLAVTSGDLARTVYDVYVVTAPDRVQGPLGVLSAAQLELDVPLEMVLVDRELGARQLGGREELTTYEITHEVLWLPVGRACLTERVAGESDEYLSYEVDSGGCS